MFQIDPVTHLLCKIVPLVLVLHHRFTALRVVVFDGDFLSNVVFGDTKFFLHLKFHREAVCIPSAFSFYLIALQCFEAAENIFHRARHHMMDAGRAIRGRRALIKRKGLFSVAVADRLFKNLILLPKRPHFLRYLRKIQFLVFFVLRTHPVHHRLIALPAVKH